MSAARTLFLTVGLPGTGKTTTARRIEAEHGALRLTKDEWVKALYGAANPAAATAVIEGRLVEIGLRVLELGRSVVIDFGLWSRDERSALRQAALEIGVGVVLCFCDVAPDEQRQRLAGSLCRRSGRDLADVGAGARRVGFTFRRPDAGGARRERSDRRPTRWLLHLGGVACPSVAAVVAVRARADGDDERPAFG